MRHNQKRTLDTGETITALLTITASGSRHKATVRVEARGCIGQAVDADERLACKRAMRQAFKWAADRGVNLTVTRPRTP